MITDQELADLAARVVTHAIERLTDDRMGLAEQLCFDPGMKGAVCRLDEAGQEAVLDRLETAIKRYLPIAPFTVVS